MNNFERNLFYALTESPTQSRPDSGATATKPISDGNLLDIQGRLDRMSLLCMSLWELLKEKEGYTEDELAAMVRKVDLSDGRLDGKVSRKQLLECGSCRRVMSARHARCLYCGSEATELSEGGVFDRTL